MKVNVNVFDESGGTGTTCFALGTKVWMNDGTWKTIEDVTLTDSLKSMNIDGFWLLEHQSHWIQKNPI